MAKFSTRTQNALDVTDHLVGAFTHIGLAAKAAQSRYPKTFKAEVAIAYFEQNKGVLIDITHQLTSAEDAYTAEQSDDPAILAHRDACFSAAAKVESETLRLLKAQPGKTATRTYGFDGARPKTSSELCTRLETGARLLTKTPIKLHASLGLEIDSAALVARMNETSSALRAAEAACETERRELREAMVLRDETLVLWNDAYQGIASQLEGIFRVASFQFLADTVRPTTRRAWGRAVIPADPTAPALVNTPLLRALPVYRGGRTRHGAGGGSRGAGGGSSGRHCGGAARRDIERSQGSCGFREL